MRKIISVLGLFAVAVLVSVTVVVASQTQNAGAVTTSNLVSNRDAESGSLSPWNASGFTISPTGPVLSGSHSFFSSEQTDNTWMVETVDLSSYAASIDAGLATADYGATGDVGNPPTPGNIYQCSASMELDFRDQNDFPLGFNMPLTVSDVYSGENTASDSITVPSGARSVEITLSGRNVDFSGAPQPVAGCTPVLDDVSMTLDYTDPTTTTTAATTTTTAATTTTTAASTTSAPATSTTTAKPGTTTTLPAPTAAAVKADPNTVTPGGAVTLSGTGCPASAAVVASVDGVTVGQGTANADGSFTLNATIPAGVDLGSSTVDISCGGGVVGAAQVNVVASLAFTGTGGHLIWLGAFVLVIGFALLGFARRGRIERGEATAS